MPRTAEPRSERPIRVGVSSCLLGEEVRYDGGHKRDRYLTDVLSGYFEWVPVCPELEIGLGVPRETLHLVEGEEGPRLVTTKSGIDHTGRMRAWSRGRLRGLAALDLSGYVFKKDSPSCGLARVRVYPAAAPDGPGSRASRPAARTGTGIFAAALRESLPLLPVEEEGRLNDLHLRENFLERVFAYRRWRDATRRRPGRHALVRFHTIHKYLVLSHSPVHYARLGRIVATLAARPVTENVERYGREFMEALAVPATPRKHANVLEHILGFFKKDLDAADRAEALGVIAEHRRGMVPLVVPLTLLRHHLARHPKPFLGEQVYLNPHPKELMLRNHV